MANFQIITNNKLVADKYPRVSSFYDCSAEGIFTETRNMIHAGCVLISHPLSGSLKPNENPYKSIVLSRSRGTLDFQSLKLIEGAFDVLRKLPVKRRGYDEQAINDFMVIDLDLVDSAMASLPAKYHH